jgi:DNA-binding CsgD family transcriptional regulator
MRATMMSANFPFQTPASNPPGLALVALIKHGLGAGVCIGDKMPTLTNRQCGILHCVFCGMENKEIAHHYRVSRQTIKNEVADLMIKIGSQDRTQLALWWWKYAIDGHEIPIFNTDLVRRDQKRTKNNRNKERRRAAPGGGVSAAEWKEILEKYNFRCVCCGTDKKVQRDHVVPLSRGGINDPSNIQPLCPKCNAKKGVQIIDYRPGCAV